MGTPSSALIAFAMAANDISPARSSSSAAGWPREFGLVAQEAPRPRQTPLDSALSGGNAQEVGHIIGLSPAQFTKLLREFLDAQNPRLLIVELFARRSDI